MPVKIDAPPPPADVHDRGGGGDRDWVALFHARNDIDAHLLAGRLNDAAIETRSIRDRGVPVWLYGGAYPRAPVTIFVRRFQLIDARIVLAEVAFDAPSAGESPLTDDSARWRIPLMWWATALALGIFFTVVALVQAANSMTSCRVPLVCTDDVRVDRRSTP